MGFWSSIANGAKAVVKSTANNVVKPVGKSVVNTVANPTTAVGNVAKVAKVSALPAAGGYLAWQNLANDKSVLESVKDVAIGEDKSAVEAVSDIAIGEKNTERIAGAIDSVAGVADKASETLDNVNGVATSMNASTSGGGLDGISNFFKGVSSGDGILGTVGNLFSNIFKGNVSGMSMVGLAAAAFLTFGRFGWMSKVAGALLGMFLIGSNSQTQQATAGQTREMAQTPESESQSKSRGMHR